MSVIIFSRNRIILILGIFVLLFVFPKEAKSNDSTEIEQLIKKLELVSGKEKVGALKEIVNQYYNISYDDACYYLKQYLELAKEYNLLDDQSSAYFYYSGIAFNQLEYDKAINYVKKAMLIHKFLGDSLKVSHDYVTLSRAYVCMRQSDSAMDAIGVAFKYFDKQKDTVRSQTIRIQLGKAYYVSDQYVESRAVLMEVVEETRNAKHYNNLKWALYWLGSSNARLGDFSEAIANFSEIIELCDTKKDVSGKLGAMQELGNVYLTIGEFAKAYQLYFDCYQQKAMVRGYRGELQFTAEYHINMGNIYRNTERYHMALNQFDSAILLIDKFDFSPTRGVIYNAMGKTWLSMKDPRKALQYFELSLQFYQEIGSRYYEAVSRNFIAETYISLGEYVNAVPFLLSAKKTNTEIGDMYGVAQNRKNLADCYFYQKQYKKAWGELDASLSYVIESKVNNNLLLDFYALYIRLCNQASDFKQSGVYFEKFQLLNTQTNTQHSKNLTDLMLKFYANELDARTELMKQTIDMQELENYHQMLKFQLLLLFTLVVLLILVIIGILYYSKIKTTKRLRHLVDERTLTIRESQQELLKLSSDKDKMYSIIAHDLRSPFNSILGFANLLQDGYYDYSDAEKKDFVRIIRGSAEQIFMLLENLLEWTRSSSRGIKINPDQIDLSLVVMLIIDLQNQNAKEKNIALVNNIPKNTFVYADGDMLRTVIRNLTSNAIKFTQIGGVVTYSAQIENAMVVCVVRDSGMGISPEDIGNLFCADSKTKMKGTANENGTGLGLILVKDFVEKNHGTITVESKLGEGSSFKFKLPSKSPDDI